MKSILQKYCLGRISTKAIIRDGLEPDCVSATQFLPESATLLERIYCILNDITEAPTCSCSSTKPLAFTNAKRGYVQFCSIQCPAKHSHSADLVKGSTWTEERREKTLSTVQEKYGVDNVFKVPKFKQKIVDTTIERYGVENISQLDSVKDRKKESALEVYGVDNVSKAPIVQKKIVDTMVEKYGVENIMYLQEYRDRVAKSQSIQSLGADTFDKISSIDWWKTFYVDSTEDIAELLGVSYSCAWVWAKKLSIETKQRKISKPHQKLIDILVEANIPIDINVKSIIIPKELDIYIPSHNIAIEVNGLYWHSEKAGKNKSYHLQKTIACQEKGIKLYHFWDSEIAFSLPIVKSMILNSIGQSISIGARKCLVQKIDSSKAKEFLATNHIQGSIGCSVFIGLIYDGAIISVAGFSKSRFRKDCDYELVRFATAIGFTIQGGFSKILNYFIQQYSPIKIVSYSDNRYSVGNVYRQTGWILDRENSPSYSYTADYNRLENRMKFQKKKLQELLPLFDHNKTEWQNMQENGYDRIWDCGTKTWIYEV